MSYVYPLNYESRGRYAEVKINRNLLYLNAANANSRTIKVTLRNIDNASHEYTVVAVTGKYFWNQESPVYTSEKVTINPGEVKEVYLDIAKNSATAPIANASYTDMALNVFVDGGTTPDVVIYPLWVLDVNRDTPAYVTFDKTVKYLIQGTTTYTEPGTGSSLIIQFFIADMSDGEYVPTTADNGILIATSPFDGTGGAVELSWFLGKGPGPYKITLYPIASGLIRVGVDLVVDYSRLGSVLGSMFSWLTAITTDAVAFFLNNKFFQYLFLAKLNPILTSYWGAQNIILDAYVDPNDKTKVHLVLSTYINVYDDPLAPAVIWAIIGLVAAAIGLGYFWVYSWFTVEMRKADVQEKQITTLKQMWNDYFAFMRDENIPLEAKQEATKFATAIINALSQPSGLTFCEGWAIGNSCIPWWVFAIAAGVLLLFLLLKK